MVKNRPFWAAFALIPALLLAGCAREPEFLPLPAQYTPPAGRPPESGGGDGLLFEMSDPAIDRIIVSGILAAPPGARMRWTTERARFRIALPQSGPVDLFLRFRVLREAIQLAGAVKVSASIDGQPLAAQSYRTEDSAELRARLPESLAREGTHEITVDVTPGWPQGGLTYGILLETVGFRRAGQ